MNIKWQLFRSYTGSLKKRDEAMQLINSLREDGINTRLVPKGKMRSGRSRWDVEYDINEWKKIKDVVGF